ncbi:hypothetical protein H696_05466 [Fonticula alba]|uniref:RING-type E3 ubiquitin transferase n=1 Tax=Fonticula alba TaxID=691883 RepID=A0A058Z190_FONAL|nr:hypothetical protein H696_05466 [Fonticula alba]KCV68000.1 hypothetical protein H696_05466 [Fonticula alba]|eukprot:XP_009497567.1 hypothetical protein H696_05466 [Fonticula alba]
MGDGESPTKRARTADLAAADDRQADSCTICLGPWGSSGGHRLVATSCGHLFGESCIIRWLAEQSVCPSCMAPTHANTLRPIFSAAIVTQDVARVATLEGTVAALEAELRHVSHDRQNLHAALARARARIADLETRLQREINARISAERSVPGSPGLPAGQLASAPFLSVACSESRVFDVDPIHGFLVTATRAPNGQGFSLLKTSLNAPDQVAYVHRAHASHVRDMQFSPRGDAVLLTASIDKSAKLFCMSSDRTICPFNLPAGISSCAWLADSPFGLALGLLNGTTHLFDTRFPSVAREVLPPPHGRPIPVQGLVPAALGSWLTGGHAAKEASPGAEHEDRSPEEAAAASPKPGLFISTLSGSFLAVDGRPAVPVDKLLPESLRPPANFRQLVSVSFDETSQQLYQLFRASTGETCALVRGCFAGCANASCCRRFACATVSPLILCRVHNFSLGRAPHFVSIDQAREKILVNRFSDGRAVLEMHTGGEGTFGNPPTTGSVDAISFVRHFQHPSYGDFVGWTDSKSLEIRRINTPNA